MRLAIISDIHANLPALESVAEQIRQADQVVCLGDVVNYGPWNDECLELVSTLPGIVMVEGNHEALFLGKESWDREIPLVQKFYHASIKHFTRRELISDLPMQIAIAGHVFTHTLGSMKIYQDTDVEPPMDCFVGHSHHAFDMMKHGRRVVNPGSVGQNRKRLDIACWAWWDIDTGAVTLEQTIYPAQHLLCEMRMRGYPDECIAYYESKL